MSITPLEDVEKDQFKYYSRDIKDVLDHYKLDLKTADKYFVGKGGIEPDWDQVIIPETTKIIEDLLWTFCAKHNISKDDVDFLNVDPFDENMFIVDQGTINYRTEEGQQVKKLENSITFGGFDLLNRGDHGLLPIVYSLRDQRQQQKDKKATVKEKLAAGKHRGRATISQLGWKRLPCIVIRVKNEVVASRFKTITNQDDSPKLPQTTEDVIQIFKDLMTGPYGFRLQDPKFVDKNGKYKTRWWSDVVDPELTDYGAKNMSFTEMTMIETALKNFVKDHNAGIVDENDDYDLINTTAAKGRICHDEVARGKYHSDLYYPLNDEFWHESFADKLINPETGEHLIGKLFDGSTQNIRDWFGYQREFWGKRVAGPPEGIVDGGMRAKKALTSTEPYRGYSTTNKVRSTTAEMDTKRKQIDKIYNQNLKWEQAYALKILLQNYEWYMKEVVNKPKADRPSIQEQIAMVKIPCEYTGSAPQKKTGEQYTLKYDSETTQFDNVTVWGEKVDE